MWHQRTTRPTYRCSFCNKPQNQVERLLTRPRGVYMCNECVDCRQQTIQKEREKEPANMIAYVVEI